MTRIVLVGAGSLQFGAQLLGDIFTCNALNGSEIVFNDINPAAVEKTRRLAQDFVDANGLDHSIEVEGDLSRALKGAGFVVIMIEVGDRFKLWDMDWKIPLQYGITQVYGENGGPGGLFHSLRIIPPILDICGKVAEVAPDATIFNFSNPMSRICTAVHRKYPQLNFVGMCHEIASLERHLPPMLGQPRSNIRYRAAGLNHFSVLAEVHYADSGEDAISRRAQTGATLFFQVARLLRNLGGFPGWRFIRRNGGLDEHRPQQHKECSRMVRQVAFPRSAGAVQCPPDNYRQPFWENI